MLGRTVKREEDPPLVVNGMEFDAKDSVRFMGETFYPEESEEQDSEEHRSLRVQAGIVDVETSSDQRDLPFIHLESNLASHSFDPKKAPGANGAGSRRRPPIRLQRRI
ncbi:unnamed protein product [Euphydryas editha]|uniref:Uncharacterized protein n=1 Tax=Euphydryas editha TaxID=104508 RepID=A0AAU9TAN7_EUPED|nr:unnamed protein product [Euphydryas editha]